MNTPNFSPNEFVDASMLNTAFTAVSGTVQTIEASTVLAGLIRPDAMTLTASGLTINAALPAPFGVFFANGVFAQAHGTQTNVDTSNYSVSFAGLVPSSGSVTAYLTASQASIQLNPIQIIGPPVGHPDYDPTFVPYTAYATQVDSLALTATTTFPNGTTAFELGRVTLAAGATGVGAINLAGGQRASMLNTMKTVGGTSGTLTPGATGAGQIYQATGALTLNLPTIGTSRGLLFGLSSQTSGLVQFQTNGADQIFGSPDQPTSGITNLVIPQGSSAFVLGMNGIWEIVGGSQYGVTAATTAAIYAAVSGLAPLASPTFTGVPAAPTPASGDNSTKLATTAFVHNALNGVQSVTISRSNFLSVNNGVSFAHGLGQIPDFFQVRWKCISPDQGYNTGDYIEMTPFNNSSDHGIGVRVTTSSISMFVLSHAVTYVSPGGGTIVSLTSSHWNVQFIAMKIG